MSLHRTLQVDCHFFSVGQGLFTYGSLNIIGHPSEFRWVYDCGTTSSQSLVKQAVADLALSQCGRHKNDRPTLDLVVISHFDKDHISGIELLLKSFRIHTVLLPYVPLSTRLLLAFVEGVDTQQRWMQFFINPARFVNEISKGNIERIVFVPPSGDESTGEVPSLSDNPLEVPERDFAWRLTRKVGDTSGVELEDASAPGDLNIEFLSPDSSLVASDIWEFLPYNDAKLAAKATGTFRQMVTDKRDALMSVSPNSSRIAALLALRDVYDRQFGKSSCMRNEISLIVYAGPTKRYNPAQSETELSYLHRTKYQVARTDRLNAEWIHLTANRRMGILHTGDAFLDTKQRATRLFRFLQSPRLEGLSCLQVMHHGSRDNWYAGLAARFSPDFSVFCSDPTHRQFQHPHAEVARDFLPFGPCQVSKDIGLHIQYMASI